MKIIVAKTSGFCGGVSNTIKKTLEVLKESKVYALGEIVHNEYVISKLKEKGLITTNDIKSIPNHSKVIIRAHGEEKKTYDKLREKEIEIIDLTCPKVKMIHDKIIEQNNCFIVIVGKRNHPEVIGHLSYAKNGYIVSDDSDVDKMINAFKLSGLNKMYVVAQTTINHVVFNNIVDIIKSKCHKTKIIVDNTICNATTIRQNETMDIAKNVDKMIIIGSMNSSNTKELVNVSSKYCKKVYFIQKKDDLIKYQFDKNDVIGITAGASTPNELILEVVNYLKNDNLDFTKSN